MLTNLKLSYLVIMVNICRSDLAYFDGLSETILSAGLVKPKPGGCLDFLPLVYTATM